MTECQGCGAWNESSRTVCVLCGTPLAETDEWDAAADLPPLPPLPDGGLSASMPDWLRYPPEPPRDHVMALAEPAAGLAPDGTSTTLQRLGAQADPRTFLSDDDFPPWLRNLAASRATVRAATAADAPRPVVAWPEWTGTPPARPNIDEPATAQPPPVNERVPAATIAARAREERRRRAPWETLLLVILFIGVVVAALWALVSNGVFNPGM